MIKKKPIYNFISGFLFEIIILILGFIIPRIMLVHYGSDVNGLTNTIAQIFTYMALLEAGVGTATKMALYRPVTENDKASISGIMSSAKRYYIKISLYYGILVAFLSVTLPFILKTSVGYFTTFFFVLFEGASGLVSFYVTQKWKCLLMASGENYIINSIEFIGKILCYAIRIILALNGVSIVYIQVGYFLMTILKVVLYSLYIKRKYSWVEFKNKSDESLLKDRGAFFITECAWVVFSSSDMIIIAIFLSTSISSVYSIYNMVFLALNMMLSSVYNSLNYMLGQRYQHNAESYTKTHDAFNSFFMSCITILMCVAYLLIIPFIKLYTVGVTDVEYIYKELPLLFCLVQLLSWGRYVAGNMTGFSGHAKLASKLSIVEAIVNVVLSIVFVIFFGIVGVLLATVVALIPKAVILNYIAEKKVLKRKSFKTFIILLFNYAIFAATVVVNKFINIQATTYWSLILFAVVLVMGYSLVVFLVNGLVNRQLFGQIIKRAKKKLVKEERKSI